MDELPDCGWIDSLPAGWIAGMVVRQRLRALIERRVVTGDLAPWLGDFGVEAYLECFGGTETEARDSIKLDDHLTAVFQRAILTGALSASSFDGHAFKALPKAAFVHLSVARNALQMGVLDLDPLWPDEWWPWSSKHWAVPKVEFETWMASQEPTRLDDLPADIALAYDGTVTPLTFREPSPRARVSLSEAVSWVAFGIALEPVQFEMALHWERLENGDLQAVQRKVAQAVAEIVAAGADSRIAFSGRHVASLWEKGATNDIIHPLKLEDYKAFTIGRDDLNYGEGLHRTYRAKNDSQSHSSERRDLFTEVKVSRDNLMLHFPRQSKVIPSADSGSPDSPIFWTDFDPEALPALRRLSDAAAHDEWWTWPEAIAWVGGRDHRNIASLRYWATEWSSNGDADVTLGAQHYMAAQWCTSARAAEDDLHHAIERGAVHTIGRTTRDGLASVLRKEVWRGGAVIYSDGAAQLVSAKNKLTAWAFDIAVHRADLVAAFPSPVDGERIAAICEADPTEDDGPADEKPFNDQQRRDWMEAQPMGSADPAHKIYKQHPRWCGTKLPEFRAEWKQVKGTRQGRPPNRKIDK
ncbi:hypothetical protein [Novosphingobium sp. FKTRR1]|uniref:hypothetical protein n=1 Tax=Novosphingobium sp. FKTRR1 TaxID=2879118 RepID=UPI001CF0568A|nr:hypothetical protein [Novosphingobium sp. FKTRR1]